MGKELGLALREARKAKELTLKAVADRLGISYPAVQQWEAGKTEPSTDNLIQVARLLEIDLTSAMAGEVRAVRTAAPAAEPFDPSSERPVTLPRPGEEVLAPRMGNRDVEVRGIAIGGRGDEADFTYNGQVIDYVNRPPGIAHRKDVFVIYAANDSMYPAIRPGAPLFIDPHRQPNIGDDVVVELADGPDGETRGGYVKRLVRRSGSKVVVEQFNPAKELEFDRADVKALLRVIPVEELLGR